MKTAKKYSCKVCLKKFISMYCRNIHMRIHSGERPYSCEICSKSFTRSSYKVEHIRIHSKEKPYSCDICSKSFTQLGNKDTHMRIHTKEKPYSCDICGKSFSQCGNKDRHMKTHTGEKPYSCQICGKSFPRSDDRNKHMRIHTKEKPYSCDICRKSFTSSRYKNLHMEKHKNANNDLQHTLKHVDVKLKKLSATEIKSLSEINNEHNLDSISEKETLDEDALTVQIDDNGKTTNVVKVKFCNSVTLIKSLSELNNEHNLDSISGEETQLREHRKVNCKNYKVSTLEEAWEIRRRWIQENCSPEEMELAARTDENNFVYISEEERHNWIHTGEKPFKCDLCEKAFVTNGELIIHKRRHAGEKPFKCDLCKKAFYSISNLTSHKKIHTGVKPFKCEMCQKSFPSNSALSMHNKSAKHLMKLESTKNTGQHFASTSFVDCGEADVKLEIKEEETLDEDPISINMEAENVEETIKQEIGEEMKDTDYLSCKENCDEDIIDTIDIVKHKIEFEL